MRRLLVSECGIQCIDISFLSGQNGLNFQIFFLHTIKKHETNFKHGYIRCNSEAFFSFFHLILIRISKSLKDGLSRVMH